MDLNDVFMSDPFLSLDNDLDDVSGKILFNYIFFSIKKTKLLN